ncbi:hypothetical protein E0H76_22510 [Rhizobium leguminosarum bv. viciae]|nr:hypothetical protein [Rhizobium leguminosarum bv. viciae]TCA82312.1 hypothetical protein E0H74_21160 [Rhizobium leguminosarum bv. viciae]TCA92775.1 hypothetical protein E0H76_22510 [Rhizobium leguminosarum bv. viciae]
MGYWTFGCGNDGSPSAKITCKAKRLKDLTQKRQIPLGRMGLPEEVAAAICFLASPASVSQGQI